MISKAFQIILAHNKIGADISRSSIIPLMADCGNRNGKLLSPTGKMNVLFSHISIRHLKSRIVKDTLLSGKKGGFICRFFQCLVQIIKFFLIDSFHHPVKTFRLFPVLRKDFRVREIRSGSCIILQPLPEKTVFRKSHRRPFHHMQFPDPLNFL